MLSLSSDSRARLAWGYGSSLALLLVSGCVLDMQGSAATDPSQEFTEVDAGKDDGEPQMDAGAPAPEAQAPKEDQDARTERLDAANPAADAAVIRPVPKDASAPTGDAGSAADAGRSDADASSADAGCTLAGTYALRTEVELSWEGWSIAGIPILSPGQGVFRMDALSVLREEGKQATVRACGVAMPDFETEKNSGVSELYGAYVPDDVWERPSIPTWTTSWGSSCNRPGCTLFTGAIEAVLGARVTSDPFVWPGPRDPRTGFMVVDDDNDGLPGLTFIVKSPMQVNAEGRAYAYPPLAPSLYARARKIMMAVGLRSQIEGKLETCDRMTGALTVMTANSRALGCMGMRQNEEFTCTPEHVGFLDENMPAWKLRTARYQAVRIAEGAGCAAVRGALPTPLPSKSPTRTP